MFDFHQSTTNDSILKITVLLFLPIICLYSLYVQIHGEFSPGGGFQAGVIFSVAYILFLIVFGNKKAENLFSSNFLLVLSSLGVLIYIVVGYITIILGGTFLEFNTFKFIKHPQQLGLFVIELGIGICIFSSMSLIVLTFYSLVHKNTGKE